MVRKRGWHWDQSLIRQPDPVARLLIFLVVAYVWTVALGSQAVAAHHAHPLIRRAAAAPERYFSLFREGLDFFVEYLEDFSCFLGLVFYPDFRFPRNMSSPQPLKGKGRGWGE